MTLINNLRIPFEDQGITHLLYFSYVLNLNPVHTSLLRSVHYVQWNLLLVKYTQHALEGYSSKSYFCLGIVNKISCAYTACQCICFTPPYLQQGNSPQGGWFSLIFKHVPLVHFSQANYNWEVQNMVCRKTNPERWLRYIIRQLLCGLSPCWRQGVSKWKSSKLHSTVCATFPQFMAQHCVQTQSQTLTQRWMLLHALSPLLFSLQGQR